MSLARREDERHEVSLSEFVCGSLKKARTKLPWYDILITVGVTF